MTNNDLKSVIVRRAFGNLSDAVAFSKTLSVDNFCCIRREFVCVYDNVYDYVYAVDYLANVPNELLEDKLR